jgi:hypothetical protein
MIAAAILEREAVYLKEARANANRRLDLLNAPLKKDRDGVQGLQISKYRDNWYRFLTHKLVVKCVAEGDLLKNAVRFVTFNYDTSLEFHLNRSLNAIDLIPTSDVQDFLSGERIMHVYGRVHEQTPRGEEVIDLKVAHSLGNPSIVERGSDQELKAVTNYLDQCWLSAQQLKTVDPDEKDGGGDLQPVKDLIMGADLIYVLGFGFDRSNIQRIALDRVRIKAEATPAKNIFYTNFENSWTVDKVAEHIFGANNLPISKYARGANNIWVERSTRNVYDAIALDFAALNNDE